MLNIATIMGRLVRDPDLRRTQSGTPVASFTMAVDRDYASNGERETDFISCVAWRGTAEFVQKYFSKGSMAIVTGRIQVRNYTDKDGNKRSATEIVADKIHFGESKKDRDEADYAAAEREGKAQSDYTPTGSPKQVAADEEDGDLPF